MNSLEIIVKDHKYTISRISTSLCADENWYIIGTALGNFMRFDLVSGLGEFDAVERWYDDFGIDYEDNDEADENENVTYSDSGPKRTEHEMTIILVKSEN